MAITVVDVFCGVGGLSLGFQNAGFTTVFANDFDASISKAYQLNHPEIPFYQGDIRELNFTDLAEKHNINKGKLDLLIGGPPCQGYSMANRKRMNDDPRNLLFLEFVRAVKELQPKCFLIENVVGMKAEKVNVGSKQRKVEDTMQAFFNELGYQISLQELRTEEFGVPQYRRRVIVIGTRLEDKKELLRTGEIGQLSRTHWGLNEWREWKAKGESLNKKPDWSSLALPTTVWQAISDLPLLTAGQGEQEMAYASAPKNWYQKRMRKQSAVVNNHISTPHAAGALQRMKLVKQGQNFRDLPKELQTKSVHSGAYGRLEADGLSPTITTRFDTPSTGRVIHPFQHRTLTVREAARIQSFPDHYIFHGTRTSQGKQVGNAVPPLAAEAIANMFKRDFFDSEELIPQPKPQEHAKA